MAPYPGRFEADVVLSDGGTVHVRPIRSDDDARLESLHSRLSAETVYLRFFSPMPRLSPELVQRFVNVDYEDRMALVAVLGDELISVARYDRLPGTRDAEVAFVVDDAHQGRGVATLLLEHLALAARENGIERFVAETLPQNRRMLDVFRSAGFGDERSFGDGVVAVSFHIDPTPESALAAERREHVASKKSVERLLAPRSIAVVGASRDPASIGNAIFRHLLAGGFAGPVYPVHPTAFHVAAVRAYPTILDVPDDIDLAVIVVPADAVPDVVDQCALKRVRAIAVISAGFAEVGTDEGRAAERALVQRARGNGMRLLGPNCMGVVNTAPAVRMNATIAPTMPPAGRVAFASQSGALGIGIIEEAAALGVGLSTFVSTGNKADVSGNDLLEYWEDDDGTAVVLLYLESFGNPRRFARVARRISRRKPIVAVKSGRAHRAGDALDGPMSRTAALVSTDTAVDALFRQTGVIRVETLAALFDVARVLDAQPLPRGRSVAIVANSGGPGLIAADACEGAGLDVVSLADLDAAATPDDFAAAVRDAIDDDGVDSVLMVFAPVVPGRTAAIATAVREAAVDAPKPIVANLLGADGTPAGGVPSFRFPEDAALALARVTEHAEWLARPEGSVPDLDRTSIAAARLIVDTALAESPTAGDARGVWLDPATATELVRTYGIGVLETRFVESVDDAVAAADALGYPVALKAGSGDILRKTEEGAIVLDLTSADQVRRAWSDVAERLGDRMGGGAVQPMAPAGVKTVAGVVQHPSFGPLVMFGAGGAAGELLGDLAFRVLPLTDVDAAELVRAPRSSPLLFGHRGAPPADVAALEELLLRVGRLVDDIPEVVEMDLQPVVASPAGAVAVDVRIRLAPYAPDPEYVLRRLR
jgi:acyl-CoA synthetase (NDP forming)/GNAT superfamily N-acetyltransferase